eukprot:6563-Pelagococcus_subviridis.AAC.5
MTRAIAATNGGGGRARAEESAESAEGSRRKRVANVLARTSAVMECARRRAPWRENRSARSSRSRSAPLSPSQL